MEAFRRLVISLVAGAACGGIAYLIADAVVVEPLYVAWIALVVGAIAVAVASGLLRWRARS